MHSCLKNSDQIKPVNINFTKDHYKDVNIKIAAK